MKKRLGIIICFLLMMLAMAGCNQSNKENNPEDELVFKVGKTEVYLDEVYIYALTVQEGYEKAYGEGVWNLITTDDKGESTDMEEVVREDIIKDIISIKLLVDHAEDYDLRLSDTELSKVADQSLEFYQSLTDEQIDSMGIKKETVEVVYAENALADKVYDRLMEESGMEISDEDARMTTFYDLNFSTYKTEEDGSTVPMTEEEIEEQKARANEALNLMELEGDPMHAPEISERYDLDCDQTRTMKASDIVKEYGENMSKQIYGVENGEHSGIITSSYGYHIIEMVTLTDEEATKNNKLSMMNEKQGVYFDEVYDKWLRKKAGHWSYKNNVKHKVYDQIPFGKDK